MIRFVLPTKELKNDVISFYNEFVKINSSCIGISNYQNYEEWLQMMINRKEGKNLPEGYVRENFYLCYDNDTIIGVFSIKFSLTDYLLKYGGHIGYAVAPSYQRRGLGTEILSKGLEIAKVLGFKRILCVCDEDNIASEKIIIKNGGLFENKLYDDLEKIFVKRFWINL